MTEPDATETEIQELEDEGASLSRWERLKLLGLPKVGLILLGLVLLTLGGINAWRAEESFALLIAGLVFVLIGVVLAPDWSSIELAYGNFSAKLLREFSGRLEQVEKTDDPVVLRRELEELRAEIDASSKRVMRRPRASTTVPLSDDFFRRIFNPPTKATHSFRKDGTVELRLDWSSGTQEQVTCQVKPPEGGAGHCEGRRHTAGARVRHRAQVCSRLPERLSWKCRARSRTTRSAVGSGAYAFWRPDR